MRSRLRRRITLGLVIGCSTLGAGAACNDTLQGSLSLVTGPDNALTQSPQPNLLSVQLIAQNNAITTVANVPLPATAGFAIPSQTGSNTDIIRITGFDDAGDAVASGQTLPVELDELSGITLNLFIQRRGQFSRLPEAGITASDAAAPLLTTLFSRYIMITDSTGTDAARQTQLYDTLTWQTMAAPPALPFAPESLVYVNAWTGSDASVEAGVTGIAALLDINAKTAQWLDLTDTTADAAVYIDASAPQGGTFAEVAGGATVYNTTTGDTYVVGPTRPKGATNAILRISATGVMSILNLSAPRAGAAATYLPGEGLMVFGGSPETGDASTAPGGEYVKDDGTVVPLACAPTDTTTGAGAVPLAATHAKDNPTQVLLAGGVTASGKSAGVRVYDYTQCTSGDAGAAWTAWSAPGTDPDGGGSAVTFLRAQVFDLDSANAVVVGVDKTGNTSAYALTQTEASPLPLRQTHPHASAIVLPNGSLAVVGGGNTPESFIR